VDLLIFACCLSLRIKKAKVKELTLNKANVDNVVKREEKQE
jgi:hypothetical protein